MCTAPAQRKDKKGWKVGLVAAAIAVSLVSLWFYHQPQDELESPQEDDLRHVQDWGGAGADSAPAAAVPDEQEQEGSGMGAWAGAALVLIVQALYLLASKCVPRSLGSVTTPASEHRKTLAADLGALLQSGQSSDVTFTVGDSQLRAHRAVLVARSPVFAAMMAHDYLEVSSGHVVITDVEADVMRQLLEFLYTDEIKLGDPQTAQKLLVVADKYQVATLKEQCELFISVNLSVKNVATCAVLASQHFCSFLRESAARFIAAHFKEVMASKGWAEAVRKHPDHVVEVSRMVAAASNDTRIPGQVQEDYSTLGNPLRRVSSLSPGTSSRPPVGLLHSHLLSQPTPPASGPSRPARPRLRSSPPRVLQPQSSLSGTLPPSPPPQPLPQTARPPTPRPQLRCSSPLASEIPADPDSLTSPGDRSSSFGQEAHTASGYSSRFSTDTRAVDLDAAQSCPDPASGPAALPHVLPRHPRHHRGPSEYTSTVRHFGEEECDIINARTVAPATGLAHHGPQVAPPPLADAQHRTAGQRRRSARR